MATEWTVPLNTGTKMPAFGLGTWQSPVGEAGAAVEAALKAGYRSIDCAHIYQNEAEIGEALQRCFKEGVVKREEIFVTSKLSSFDNHPELVESACRVTLKNLQLEYLDLYLIHAPFAIKKGIPPTLAAFQDDSNKLGYDADRIAKVWENMESLVAKGLVRAIGISNFTITKTDNLLKTAKVIPAVNQVENHPYFQQPKLKEYCSKKGITLMAYSPLGSPGRPAMTKKEDDPSILEDPVIGAIAAKHGVSPAQVCIAFPLHRGMVVIPKSVKPVRIAENLKATEVKLDDDDMKQLTGLDRNRRLLELKIFLKSNSTSEETWDISADEAFVV